MHLSCSSCVEAHRSLPDALARIGQLGFRCVDLLVVEGMQHLHPSQLAAAEPEAGRRENLVKAVTRAVADSGLSVSALNCGFSVPFGDDAHARAQIEREYLAILDLANEVSCSQLTIQIGTYDQRVGRVESFDRVAAGLTWLAGLSGDRNVRLTFEPHHGSPAEKPADALYMAKRLWPDVGVTYDPSHFAMQPDIESLAATEALLGYTTHVHVRNAAPGRMQTPMSDGTVDFAWLVSALERRGYAGALAIEYLDGEEAEALKLRDVLLELGVAPGRA